MTASSYYVGSASVAGSGTARTVTVSTATAAGDTLLVIIAVSVATLTISSVTDSKSNVYTLDRSFTTTLPYMFAYRSQGQNGGPSGAPTVALTTSDTLTVTTAAVSGTMTAYVCGVTGMGGIDTFSASMSVGASATSLGTSLTPTGDQEYAVMADISQAAGGAVTVSAPFTVIDSRETGTSVYGTYASQQLGNGTAGVSQTGTITIGTAANIRGFMWMFLPPPALLPQQVKTRRTAVWTRIVTPDSRAVYGR